MVRKVLVYTFGNQSHDASISAAAAFAAQHDASLTGLFVKPEIGGYSATYGAYPLNVAYVYAETQKEFEEKTKTQFNTITSRFNIATHWQSIDESVKQSNPAFYADLIFVCQPDNEDHFFFNNSNFVDHLITSTGIPTVVVPNNWSSDKFAQHPVVAWKETREAAGAVRETLALMREAIDLNVVNITKRNKPDGDKLEGIEISEYLGEKKISCKFSAEAMVDGDRNEAHTLLRHVESNGRDLIIMGGYGHSRLREIILGGMTRELIKKSTIPVLLCH